MTSRPVDTNNTHNGLFYYLKRIYLWFRAWNYPKHFSVYLEDVQTGELKHLPFTAIRKEKDKGRLVGDVEETLVITHEDYVKLFRKKFWQL